MKLKITNKKIIIQENYGVFKSFVGDTYEAIGKFMIDSGKVLGNFTKLGFDLTSNITQGILGLKNMSEMSMSIKKSTENFNKKVSENIKSLDNTTLMMLRDAGISEAEAIAIMNFSLPGFFLTEMLNSKINKNSNVRDIVDKSKEIEIKNGYDRFIYLIFYENFTGLSPKTASINNECLQYIRNWILNDTSFGNNAVKFFEEVCKLDKFHTNVKTLYTSVRQHITLKTNFENAENKITQTKKNFDNFFRSYQTKIKEDGDINNEYIGNIKTILIIVAYTILAEKSEEIREKYFKMTLPDSEEVKKEIEELSKDLEGVKAISIHCLSLIFSIDELLKSKLKGKESISSENFIGNDSLLSIYRIKLNDLSSNLKNKDIIGKLLNVLQEDLEIFKTGFIEIERNIDDNKEDVEKQSILKTAFLEFLSKLFDQLNKQVSDLKSVNNDIENLNKVLNEKTSLIKDKLVSETYDRLKNSIDFLQSQVSLIESDLNRTNKSITDLSTKIKINADKLGVVESNEDDEDDDIGDNTLTIQNFSTKVN